MTIDIDARIARLMEMADADFETMKATPEWKAWDKAESVRRAARGRDQIDEATVYELEARQLLMQTDSHQAMQSAIGEIVDALQDKYGVEI